MDELVSRQLPHSVEAEQAVLGSMLIDDRCVADVVERLRPDDFYMRQNRCCTSATCTSFCDSDSMSGLLMNSPASLRTCGG